MNYSLLDEIIRMQKKMDYLLSSNYGAKGYKMLPSPKGHQLAQKPLDIPLADFWETNNTINLEIDLPGMKKEDIHVNVENGVLEVRAEKKGEKREEKKGYFKMERSYQGYFRSFVLPQNADITKVKTGYADGVLKIGMRKKEAKKLLKK
jgi:HSP20 family molecular chaperone IbpA